MKKKILSIVLSFSMIFSTTGFAFADADLDSPPAEPAKPKVENYQDNDKIEQYNKEATEYNKEVDNYNAAVDKEYEEAVIDTNKKNEEGQQKQTESQKKHDEAVEKNKEIDEYNQNIDKKYEEDSAKYNVEKEQYDKDLEKYNTDMEQYRSNYNEQSGYEVFKTTEEYKNYAESWNTVFERDKGYHEKTKDRGIINKTNNINEIPTNFNELEDTEDLRTISIIKGEPSEKKYKVITIALYIVGSDTYWGNEYELEKYGTLNPHTYEHIVQAKWESTTVGENDTVIIQSENNLMIKYTNGNFFNYVSDDYIEGHWHLSTTERGDMEELDRSWKAIYSQTGFDKNIYVIYTYGWRGKYPTAVMPIAPEIVQKGEYKDKIEVPEVILWENLPGPIKRNYLPYLSLMNLFSIPTPTKTDENTPTFIAPTQTPIKNLNKTNNQLITNNLNNNLNLFIDRIEKPNTTKEITRTSIIDTKGPLTSKTTKKYWALINLIAAVLTILLALILIIMIFINKRKENEEIKIKNKIGFRLIGALVAIVSGLVFLITEDTTLPMTWTDKWTLLMIIMFIIEIIIAILSRRKEKEKEEN